MLSKKNLKYLVNILVCVAMTFVSCSTALSYSPPKWFLLPPNNDEASMYGAGHGTTVEDATNEALNQIASKMSITVGSAFEKTETAASNSGVESYNRQVSNNITSKVAKIKFNNYEVINKSNDGQEVFLLVSVDKKRFVSEKVTELKNADEYIYSTYALGADKSIIERINLYRGVTSKIKENNFLLGIIQSVEPSFNVQSYHSKYNKLAADIKAVSSRLQVYLDYGPDSKELIPVVTKHLNDASIVIVPSYDPDNKDLVALQISSELKRLELYGAKIVKFRTNFEAKTAAGNTVAAAKIETKGSSTISFNEAYQAAAINLDKKIKEAGVWAMLGMEKEAAQQ
ncbi:LPP20 family lipoprotein [Geomonas oryzisoli]|uniref:LPP20 family lipoprotein n=1 Tax=Geomonas oryzisoli TaxID=2847992 RepID=A0ABX8J6M5_9BACT|nr:LPP20 family lipoprotein [Geomonas oryzisoli]QWV92382.1 LPP20 family lipoprotein [Geomonas oryzisoli]